MSRINVPTLIELASPDEDLTVLNLSDPEHPVNIKGISGKRKGMCCMIGSGIYVATGSSPDSSWQEFGNKTPTGWGLYLDDQYTLASPLVINAGTTVLFPNNMASKNETYLPSDGTLYSGNRITPNTLGSSLALRVTFKAKSSIGNGGFSVSVDISAAGDGSITVVSYPTRMLRGSGIEAVYTVNLPMYALETFIANGGAVRITSEAGTLSVYDISFLITKP